VEVQQETFPIFTSAAEETGSNDTLDLDGKGGSVEPLDGDEGNEDVAEVGDGMGILL